jgi:hypothetical protein
MNNPFVRDSYTGTIYLFMNLRSTTCGQSPHENPLLLTTADIQKRNNVLEVVTQPLQHKRSQPAHFPTPPPTVAEGLTPSVNTQPAPGTCMSEIRNVLRPMHEEQGPQLPRSKPQSLPAPHASLSQWMVPSRRLGGRVTHRPRNAKPASLPARRPPRCASPVCVSPCPSVAAWPGAPTAPQRSSAPLRLLVWFDRASPCFGQTREARKAFHAACMRASVHALHCAKYEVRTTNCAPHMRLTIVLPLHAQQCRAGLKRLQRFVRQHLGWHVVLDTPQLGCHIPNVTEGLQLTLTHLDLRINGGPMDVPPTGR